MILVNDVACIVGADLLMVFAVVDPIAVAMAGCLHRGVRVGVAADTGMGGVAGGLTGGLGDYGIVLVIAVDDVGRIVCADLLMVFAVVGPVAVIVTQSVHRGVRVGVAADTGVGGVACCLTGRCGDYGIVLVIAVDNVGRIVCADLLMVFAVVGPVAVIVTQGIHGGIGVAMGTDRTGMGGVAGGLTGGSRDHGLVIMGTFCGCAAAGTGLYALHPIAVGVVSGNVCAVDQLYTLALQGSGDVQAAGIFANQGQAAACCQLNRAGQGVTVQVHGCRIVQGSAGACDGGIFYQNNVQLVVYSLQEALGIGDPTHLGIHGNTGCVKGLPCQGDGVGTLQGQHQVLDTDGFSCVQGGIVECYADVGGICMGRLEVVAVDGTVVYLNSTVIQADEVGVAVVIGVENAAFADLQRTAVDHGIAVSVDRTFDDDRALCIHRQNVAVGRALYSGFTVDNRQAALDRKVYILQNGHLLDVEGVAGCAAGEGGIHDGDTGIRVDRHIVQGCTYFAVASLQVFADILQGLDGVAIAVGIGKGLREGRVVGHSAFGIGDPGDHGSITAGAIAVFVIIMGHAVGIHISIGIGVAADTGVGGVALLGTVGSGHHSGMLMGSGFDVAGIIITDTAVIAIPIIGPITVGVGCCRDGFPGIGMVTAVTGKGGVALCAAGGRCDNTLVVVTQGIYRVIRIRMAADRTGIGGVAAGGTGGVGDNALVVVTQSLHRGIRIGIAAKAAGMGGKAGVLTGRSRHHRAVLVVTGLGRAADADAYTAATPVKGVAFGNLVTATIQTGLLVVVAVVDPLAVGVAGGRHKGILPDAAAIGTGILGVALLGTGGIYQNTFAIGMAAGVRIGNGVFLRPVVVGCANLTGAGAGSVDCGVDTGFRVVGHAGAVAQSGRIVTVDSPGIKTEGAAVKLDLIFVAIVVHSRNMAAEDIKVVHIAGAAVDNEVADAFGGIRMDIANGTAVHIMDTLLTAGLLAVHQLDVGTVTGSIAAGDLAVIDDNVGAGAAVDIAAVAGAGTDGHTAGDPGFAALHDQQSIGVVQTDVTATGGAAIPVDTVCHLAVVDHHGAVGGIDIRATVSGGDAAGDGGIVQIEGIAGIDIYHTAVGGGCITVALQGTGVFRACVHQAQHAGAGAHIEAAQGHRAGEGIAVQVNTDLDIVDLDLVGKLQILGQVVVTAVCHMDAVKGQPGHIAAAVGAGCGMGRQSLAAVLAGAVHIAVDTGLCLVGHAAGGAFRTEGVAAGGTSSLGMPDYEGLAAVSMGAGRNRICRIIGQSTAIDGCRTAGFRIVLTVTDGLDFTAENIKIGLSVYRHGVKNAVVKICIGAIGVGGTVREDRRVTGCGVGDGAVIDLQDTALIQNVVAVAGTAGDGTAVHIHFAGIGQHHIVAPAGIAVFDGAAVHIQRAGTEDIAATGSRRNTGFTFGDHHIVPQGQSAALRHKNVAAAGFGIVCHQRAADDGSIAGDSQISAYKVNITALAVASIGSCGSSGMDRVDLTAGNLNVSGQLQRVILQVNTAALIAANGIVRVNACSDSIIQNLGLSADHHRGIVPQEQACASAVGSSLCACVGVDGLGGDNAFLDGAAGNGHTGAVRKDIAAVADGSGAAGRDRVGVVIGLCSQAATGDRTAGNVQGAGVAHINVAALSIGLCNVEGLCSRTVDCNVDLTVGDRTAGNVDRRAGGVDIAAQAVGGGAVFGVAQVGHIAVGSGAVDLAAGDRTVIHIHNSAGAEINIAAQELQFPVLIFIVVIEVDTAIGDGAALNIQLTVNAQVTATNVSIGVGTALGNITAGDGAAVNIGDRTGRAIEVAAKNDGLIVAGGGHNAAADGAAVEVEHTFIIDVAAHLLGGGLGGVTIIDLAAGDHAGTDLVINGQSALVFKNTDIVGLGRGDIVAVQVDTDRGIRCHHKGRGNILIAHKAVVSSVAQDVATGIPGSFRHILPIAYDLTGRTVIGIFRRRGIVKILHIHIHIFRKYIHRQH